MKTADNISGVDIPEKKVKQETIIEVFLFALFMTFLIATRSSQHLLFHTTSELFTCGIAFGLFFTTLHISKINENSFLVFLGIGYFFVGVVDMFHVFTYSGVSVIFKNGDRSMVVQFWTAARYLTVITLLGSTLMLYKNIKCFNLLKVFFFYAFICALILVSIVYLRIFPQCYIIGQGLTGFKIVSEYLIAAGFMLSAVLYYKLKGNMDHKLYAYMEGHLLLYTLSELLFTGFFSPNDWTNIWGHIVRVVSYLFLYKAVIETGLQRPYSVLFQRLDIMGNELSVAADKLEYEQRQRKMMEELIVSNQQCYELVINNCNEAIVMVCEGRVNFANEMAAELLEAGSSIELIGKDLLSFIHPEDREKSRIFMEHLLSKAEVPDRNEYRIITQDGRECFVESMSCYLLYKGKPSCISIIRDISQQIQIKKLKEDIRNSEKALNSTKEYNKLLTEFFSNISHELKTPLNVILGAIQVMALSDNAEKTRQSQTKANRYLRVMKQNCYRLLRLVNNLIDLSKFDAGYYKLNLRNRNIISTVEDIVQSVVDYVENRGIDIVFDTDTEEKILAFDGDKLERIVLNLLSNSIKFTDEGGRISVEMKDMGDWIGITVRDTGIGIPADKLDTILERFSQVDKTLTRNHEGSGIGLSLVKTLVEMHQGKMSISSVEGEGSEVRIELPVRLVEEEAAVSVASDVHSNIERIQIEFSDIYSNE